MVAGFLDEMQLKFTICLLNNHQSMKKIQPHSADSQRKGIHTILSCNIQNWISGALLASTLATFRKVMHVIPQQHTPQELHFNRSLLCGQGTGQHWRSAKTQRKKTDGCKKACSLVQTCHQKKIEELIYSLLNSLTFYPCVFTRSPYACLWIVIYRP